ncbi:ABC transporter permease [Cellulomonas carbonis]|uniref:Cell division protein FtsX n=1 Tax=Cellulomonas carbonis T26 TaxID=947969 RepID=A0A0A0BSZ0_9CELL|nr:ABC transporter permease [Cellulomonas carbonis]KGM10229.1 hypothetical protein N868_16060 [Cellulomonas carbonis T26]GGC16836.1 permease [Cellulomonas carbonis]
MTGLVSAVVEAWDELRIHKVRVLLALVGVAVAVCAITGITAAAQMLTQTVREQSERDGGRDLTLTVNLYPAGATEAPPPAAAYVDAYRDLVERYEVEYASLDMWTQLPVRLPEGRMLVEGQVVEADYGVIHRVQPVQGRWFTDGDAALYAPTVVVNETFLRMLGATDLSVPPTVLLGGDEPVLATVVGVVADRWSQESPRAFVLHAQYERWQLAASAEEMGWNIPSLRIWVPPAMGDEVTDAVRRDLAAAVPGTQVDVWPSTADFSVLDGGARWVVLGIGAFTLLLGGLGLLNISLVTVRYRIREIGIRRSFGATSGRVFFGVLMESVVATVVAGAVGVVLAVAILSAVPFEVVLGTPLQEPPPFPVSAAVTGMVCATAVGALAGLVPAVVAVRVKVIDAIRY